MIDSWGSEAILDAFAPKNVKKIDFAAMEKKEWAGIWKRASCWIKLG